jgi:hypothetical protein
MTDFGTFERAERNCAIENNFHRAIFEIWLPTGSTTYARG